MTATAHSRPSFKTRWYHKVLLMGASGLLACSVAEIALRSSSLVRNVGPAFTEYDPDFGKRLKQSFSCVRRGPDFTMSLSTNSLRFRGPEPDGSTKRGIVFLGDSFTMGYGVDDGEEYPRRVGELLLSMTKRRLPIVNMGMGNSGNGRWLKFLRLEVAQHEPQLVVFQVCGNDYTDNRNEGLFRYTDADGLIEQSIPDSSWLRQVQSLTEAVPGLSSSYLFCYFKQAALSRRGASEDEPAATAAPDREPLAGEEELTYALIEAALTTTASHGWPTLILSVDDDPRRNEELASRCRAHGLDLLVIPSRAQRADLYFKADGHWNAAGHRYAAQKIAEAIVEKQLLDG